jgi:glycerate kinase
MTETYLIAFDKFKGSMPAHVACEAARRGLLAARPQARCQLAPLSDGGEGFASILTEAVSGQLHKATVTGPTGQPVEATWGMVDLQALGAQVCRVLDLPERGQLAVIEMSQAAGYEQVPAAERDPRQMTTAGVGQLLALATKAGAQALLLGIGGSATNDAGLGALMALGLSVRGPHDEALQSSAPAHWLKEPVLSGQPMALPPIRIACDVTNPLLGEAGCTRVFGPQKGLPEEGIDAAEDQLAAMSEALAEHFAQDFEAMRALPGAGAAGGIGYGLSVAYQAQLVPGFELVSNWLRLEASVRDCDHILTGEGQLDATSLEGKGPGALVELGQRFDTPVSLFAGRVDASFTASARQSASGNPAKAHAITPESMPLQEALTRGPELLQIAVKSAFSA